MPLISIITSTLNSERHIGDLATSLHAQLCKDFEWIIVDGKSSDQTLSIIEENKEIVSSFISEPDYGIYDAWNKGVNLARGDWICFVGADDFLVDPNAIGEVSSSLLGIYPEYRIGYRAILLVNQKNQELYKLGDPWSTARKNFRDIMTLPHPGLMHHRTLFEEFGLFDTSFKIAGDYEFLLRALKNKEPYYCEGTPVVAMRTGGLSSNPRHSLRSLLESRKASRKHGRLLPRSPFFLGLARILIRWILFRSFGEHRSKILMDYGRSLLGKPPHWTRLE
jgi:glycosyltransferase involved in cell wall biosynthesis